MPFPPVNDLLSRKAFDVQQLPGVLQAVVGNQKWTQTCGKVVVAAVGIGAFALPERVGQQGILSYVLTLIFITIADWIACTWWYEHKEMWNKRAKQMGKNPITNYYEWGEAAMGPAGRMAMQAVQFLYYTSIAVVFINLMGAQMKSFLGDVTRDDKLVSLDDALKGLKNDELFGFRQDVSFESTIASTAKSDYRKPSQKFVTYDITKGAGVSLSRSTIGELAKDAESDTYTWKPLATDKIPSDQTKIGTRKIFVKTDKGAFVHINDVKPAGMTKVTEGLLRLDLITLAIFGIAYLFFEELDNGKSVINFSNIGTVGVFISWSMVIIKLMMNVGEDAWGATPDQFAVMPSAGTSALDDSSMSGALDSYFTMFATCLGSFGVVGLMPDWSQVMKHPKELPKAVTWGHVICFVVYCLPTFVYYVIGNDKVSEYFDGEGNNMIMVVLFKSGVIANVIVTYALLLNTPSTLLEKILRGDKAKGKPWLIRIAIIAVTFSINWSVGGYFGDLFGLVSAAFNPFAALILPTLFDFLIINQLKKYDFAELNPMRTWPMALRVWMIAATLLGFACTFFGVKNGYVALTDNSVGGLSEWNIAGGVFSEPAKVIVKAIKKVSE